MMEDEEKMMRIISRGSEKPDRKTVERNRRIHMKYLCGKLVSLIPPHHFHPSKESLSQQDQLDQAAIYIKQLRERVEKLEKMKKKKNKLSWGEEESSSSDRSATTAAAACTLLKSPVIEVRDLGSTLQVVLMSSSKTNFMLRQVIRIVEEEGAQVVSASFSTVGDKVFHTLHAQVKVARLGMETSRIYGRLKQLIT